MRTTESVALFDGPVALDSTGHGTLSFDVPDFDGQLHLMASAWSKDAVGNAQADITARDPVFPDLGLPRFLAPGIRHRHKSPLSTLMRHQHLTRSKSPRMGHSMFSAPAHSTLLSNPVGALTCVLR